MGTPAMRRGAGSRTAAACARWGLAVASVTWVAALWMAPAWRQAPQASPTRVAATLVYVIGAGVCHQRPERSFARGRVPLPVCGRCAGLYAGGAIGLLVAALVGRPSRATARRWRTALGVVALPTAATLVLEWSGVGVSNLARAVTAVPPGALAGLMLAEAVAVTLVSGTDDQRPITTDQRPSPNDQWPMANGQ